MTVLLLLLGLLLIIAGANFLTDGAAGIAKRFGISEFIIGLTIVAVGTSTPELVVSLFSAIKGNGDIAVGNVVGSNLFNALFILGLTALFVPIPFSRDNIRKDVPLGILASVILLVMLGAFFSGAPGHITRTEGVILLLFFALFLAYSIREGKNPDAEFLLNEKPAREKASKPCKLWLLLLMAAGGLGGLIWGGSLFLDNAVRFARAIGVSESVIAVILLAGGTSLPELATSLVAALKGRVEIALGNVVGSNIANIFLILGISATVSPLTIGSILPADIWAMTGTSVLLFVSIFTFHGRKINRADGVIFLLLYAVYIWWVLSR